LRPPLRHGPEHCIVPTGWSSLPRGA
jgi:hypothetical protein